ncbi:MAG: phage antirepressor KilAC domain-containing protein [Romboutsia sp.]
MNELQVIYNQEVLGKDFHIYGTVEEPLFLAKDVAEWIEYSKRSDGSYQVGQMLKTVDEDEKIIAVNNVNGGREQWFLTEDGLYEVLMQSRKPVAKEFKKEVKKILKQIRKTGGYIPLFDDDDVDAIMAKALIIAQKTLDKKNELIKNMQPKADYFDALVDRSLLTNFRDTAKELHIRQKDFINWLLENNFIYRDSNNKIKPTAQAIEEGLFELKEFTNEHFSSTQTLVTPKGRETFRLLLEKNKLM